ncbi:hypothetical protein AB4379_12125 [Vibrio breoganii]
MSTVTALQVIDDIAPSSLSTIPQDVITHLTVAHHKAPKQKDKKAAMLKIGILLAEARAEFASDKEFGSWVKSNIIEKCDTNLKKPTNMTLYRYRMLAEFTKGLEFDEALKLCLTVGFTNVYKLMEDKNRALLKDYREGNIKVEDLDKKLNPAKYIKQQDLVFTGFKKEVANFTESQAEELILLLAEHHNIELN